MMEQQSFEQTIQSEIKARIDAFSADKSMLVSYVRQNASIVKEYKGRQVFEMLQNMDDQMAAMPEDARISQIVFDKKDKKRATLVFRNKGNPFSAEGIKSIMLPNLSPKMEGKTIGNKGLGFRSLLNWKAESIFIRSNGLELSFSADVVRGVVERNPGLKANTNGLPRGQQLPILMVPDPPRPLKVRSEWATEIELRNVSSLDEIEGELVNFQPELLLFLPNLRVVEILIRSNDVQERKTIYRADEWHRAPGSDGRMWLRNIFTGTGSCDRWLAFRENGTLEGVPVEDGSSSAYNLSIAVPLASGRRETLDHVLRNYLPIRSKEQAVEIQLPCLVHVTVDLTPDRNALLPDSYVNRKIFDEKLFAAFIRFAEYLRDDLKNSACPLLDDKWYPWRLLSPEGRSGNHYVESLYAKLREAVEKVALVPCADGLYRTPGDSRFFATVENNNEIATFFNRHPTLLPNYVRLEERFNIPESFGNHPCLPRELETSINKSVQGAGLSDKELAELIHLLWQIRKTDGNKGIGRFLVLRDKDHRFFNVGETIYTPVGESPIFLPDFMPRVFLSETLFAAMKEEFSQEIGAYKEKHDRNPVRSFCRNELKTIVDIEFFDKTAVTRQMVSECRRLLGDEADILQKSSLVSQLLRALYKNYVSGDDSSSDEIEEDQDYRAKMGVPVEVAGNGVIRETCDMLFESAKAFYGDTLRDEFLGDPFLDDSKARRLLGDVGGTDDQIRAFFRTFGVRCDVRVRYAALSLPDDRDYIGFLTELGDTQGGLPKPSVTETPIPENERQVIPRLLDADVIARLPLDSFLRILSADARGGLAELVFERPVIKWKGANKWYSRQYTVDWSFCAFQLKDSRRSLVLEDHRNELDNAERTLPDTISGTVSLPQILIRMGARRSFEDLSPKELYDKMAALNRSDGVQKFYKRIRDALNAHLDRCGNNSPERRNMELKFSRLAEKTLEKLWARKGSGPIEKVEREKIRYWDNAMLSRNILADCWKLEIGHRVGAASVEKLFGVTNLDRTSAVLIADETKDNGNLTKELRDRLYARLVLLLAVRCRELSSQDEIKRVASTLRSLPELVRIVYQGAFLFEGRRYGLTDGDLIQTENGFVVCSTDRDLKQALGKQSFCVAIGEMLGIRLRLADSLVIAAMRNIVKCSDEEIDMIRRSDLSEADWNLASEALGLSEDEKRIWEVRLGRTLSDIEERELAFRESRSEKIGQLIGTGVPENVPLDIPLGDMDNAQTDAFVRWLAVPANVLGERTVEKLRLLRHNRFDMFRRDAAGFVATEIHCRLEKGPVDGIRAYIPMVRRFKYESCWFSEELANLLTNNPFVDDSDLWQLFRSVVKVAFAVNLPELVGNCESYNEPEAEAHYQCILVEAEMDLNELDAEKQSLAFFPGNEDSLRKIVEEVRSSDDASSAQAQKGSGPVATSASILMVSSLDDLPSSFIRSRRESANQAQRFGKTAHYQSDGMKRKIGRRAEELVWNAIQSRKNVYRNPFPWSSLLNKSGTANDNVHYDISYKTSEGEERYVEVKAFDGHMFFMSRGEYQFANDPMNWNKYVLALVSGNEIRFIEAPFAPGSPFKDVLRMEVDDYTGHFES